MSKFGHMPTTTLTAIEHEILKIESQQWRYPGNKETAIRERLDMSTTRFYQALNRLLDREDVLAHDPILVKRLRMRRGSRGLSMTA